MKKKSIVLFAGLGRLPILLWQKAKKNNDTITTILFTEYKNLYPQFWQKQKTIIMSIGQLGQAIDIIKTEKADYFILAGHITRPPAINKIKTDTTAKIFLAKNMGLFQQGDDALLSALTKFIDKKTSAKLLAVTDYLDDKRKKGLWVGTMPNKKFLADYKKGRNILQNISRYELGQGIIMAGGLVLALETMTGTNAMMKSASPLTRHRQAIMVKDFKKQQNRKLDIPALGPTTISTAKKYHIKGIFCHHQTNVIDPDKVKKLAEKNKIFIYFF